MPALNAERDWSGWTEALHARGSDVCLVDLPAHGGAPSPRSMTEVTSGRIVEALAQAARRLRGERASRAKGHEGRSEDAHDAGSPDAAQAVDVIGYSLGARLAWELPRVCRVRRLVLGGIGPRDPFAAVDTRQLLAHAGTGSDDPQRAAGRTVVDDALTKRLIDRVSQPGLDARGLALVIAGLAAEPFVATPGNAPRVPTLFVVGSEDRMMQDGLHDLVSLVPQASLVVVPGDHRGALLGAAFREHALRFLDADAE